MPSAPRPEQRFSIGGGPWPAAEARVARLVSLSNRGDYEDAARAAEPLLAEGVHDIQVVVRFQFGAFLDRGFAALPEIFTGLAISLEGADAALGPPGGKPWAPVEVALVWLGRTLRDRIEFHQAQRDETWKAWIAAGNPALCESIGVAAARLAAEIGRALPASRALEHLAALETFASGPLRALVPKPQPAPKPAQPPPPLPRPIMEAAPPEPAPPPAPRLPPAPPEPPPQSDLDSPALRLLRDKIAGFEALMERGDHARAAIVASDITRIVESFDPRVYLPRLFAGFYRRMASGAEELAPHWDNPNSLSSRALEQLYQVDLHAFLEAE